MTTKSIAVFVLFLISVGCAKVDNTAELAQWEALRANVLSMQPENYVSNLKRHGQNALVLLESDLVRSLNEGQNNSTAPTSYDRYSELASEVENLKARLAEKEQELLEVQKQVRDGVSVAQLENAISVTEKSGTVQKFIHLKHALLWMEERSDLEVYNRVLDFLDKNIELIERTKPENVSGLAKPEFVSLEKWLVNGSKGGMIVPLDIPNPPLEVRDIDIEELTANARQIKVTAVSAEISETDLKTLE